MTRTLTTSSATNRLSVATYDLSGNVMSWAGRQYRWDAFNMLTQQKPTAGNGHTFLYGPGDERVLAIDWTQGTDPSAWIETWTLRDLDGTPLRQFRQAGGNTASAHWSFHRDYVYRNGALLAAHTPQGLRHFHLDHLGSPRLVTNASGDTVAQHVYFPFGEEATDPGQDGEVMKFTGHERDDLDSGGTTADLDYMHARYFSAHLGRFHSPDPVDSGSLPHPQSWNKYSYVRSNPLKFLDPTGEVEVHFTFNAFIPFDSVAMPVEGRIFEGDGAGFSAGRTSVRIQQQFTIETDPSVSANPLVSVSKPKIGVTRELNAQGDTIATGQASGEGVTVSAQRLSDGTVLLTARGHASNPLVSLAPGIDYSYRIAVTPDGKVICLNCSHDRFPAFDGYIAVGSGRRAPLFQNSAAGGWLALAGLFPLSPNRSFAGLLYDFGGEIWLDGVYIPQ